MLRSFVTIKDGRYIVKTAKVTPFGFVQIRKTGSFKTLPEADKKADTCNYIWKRLEEYRHSRELRMAGVL